MSNNLKVRIGGNLILIAISLLGLALVYLHLDISPFSKEGIVIDGLLIYLIIERLLTIVDIGLHERSLNEFAEKAVLLKNAVLDSHIEVYTDNNKAYVECIDIAKRGNVLRLKNTVFRYGGNSPYYVRSTNHDEWMKAKEALLRHGKSVTEIFDFNVIDYKLKKLDKSVISPRARFNGSCISSDEHTLIPMVIFEYKDNAEIFIGGDIDGSEQWPVFRTRNKKVVEYFTKYFDLLYKKGEEF